MMANDESYSVVSTPVPPTIMEREGTWFIQIHAGTTTYEAPLGFWFLAQIFQRMVIPALLRKDEPQS